MIEELVAAATTMIHRFDRGGELGLVPRIKKSKTAVSI
jgi:hypothetical protein